jgi:Ca2+-binding EF-hand superfamily protein
MGLFGPPPNPMFTAIDADGDGVITKAELRKAIVALKKLDADKDGNITLAEASPMGGPVGDPAQFVDRIMQHDKDGNGLTPDEVPAPMQPMLQNADQNGDGVITRDELAANMEKMRNQFRGAPGSGPFPGGPRGFAPGAGRPRAEAEQITGQFLQYDRDGDGRLTANELPREAARMLQGGDQNNDGAIDAGELQAAIARMGGAARAWAAGREPGGLQSTPFRDPNRRNRQRQANQN